MFSLNSVTPDRVREATNPPTTCLKETGDNSKRLADEREVTIDNGDLDPSPSKPDTSYHYLPLLGYQENVSRITFMPRNIER